MKNKKTAGPELRKKIFVIFFVFLFLFSSVPTHPAHAWIASEIATLNNAMNQMLEMIKSAILGALKQVAVNSLNVMMAKLVGGGGGSGPMFITNWQDYLIRQPARNTQKYMNDYLTKATRGKGTVTSYAPNKAFEGTGPGSFNTGLSQYGNYFGRLMADTQKSLVNTVFPVTYEGNPSQMFAKGTMKDLSTYISGNNNPWAFKWNAQAAQMKSLEEERDLYAAKAVAGQGFTGKEVNGQTVTPGSLVKDSLANTEDIGNKIIAAAANIPELLIAVATKLIAKSVQNGIGNVQSQVQRQINDVTNRNVRQTQNAINTSGPGILYKLKP